MLLLLKNVLFHISLIKYRAQMVGSSSVTVVRLRLWLKYWVQTRPHLKRYVDKPGDPGLQVYKLARP